MIPKGGDWADLASMPVHRGRIQLAPTRTAALRMRGREPSASDLQLRSCWLTATVARTGSARR